jgi:hypothetical protein
MSAVFQLGYYPIRTVMYSRYLSVSGFRFLRLPTATEELGLPYGFLTGTSSYQTSLGLLRSARLRCDWFRFPLYSEGLAS